MTTWVLEAEPSAVDILFDTHVFTAKLDDGRALSIPLAWFPRLQHASPNERNNWRLLGNGYTVEWPDLDEHMRFEELLADRRSGESPQSFQHWLSQRS